MRKMDENLEDRININAGEGIQSKKLTPTMQLAFLQYLFQQPQTASNQIPHVKRYKKYSALNLDPRGSQVKKLSIE